MLNAKALFEAGRLSDAVQALNQSVKAQPSDTGLRTFLFELLCFQGAMDRAARQLDVIASQAVAPGVELAIQAYRALLNAEVQRRDVFHGDALPKFITPPGAHIERYVVLLKKLQWATADQLSALLAEAEDGLPDVTGERGGKAFTRFRDADDRTAGVLEVFNEGEYLWVPIDQIVRLEITPPRKLRELMWVQARLEVVGQPAGDVFLPTRYTDSYLHASENVKLGRITEWEALHDCMVVGHGQRVFLIDDEEVSLLDLGSVSISASPTGERA